MVVVVVHHRCCRRCRHCRGCCCRWHRRGWRETLTSWRQHWPRSPASRVRGTGVGVEPKIIFVIIQLFRRAAPATVFTRSKPASTPCRDTWKKYLGFFPLELRRAFSTFSSSFSDATMICPNGLNRGAPSYLGAMGPRGGPGQFIRGFASDGFGTGRKKHLMA